MTNRRLYELVSDDGASISPFVWRTKYALAAKGLDYESTPLAFTEISQIEGGRFNTLPVLVDGIKVIGDSWAIADHLDVAYPARQPLFPFAAERSKAVFFDDWIGSTVRPLLFRICAFDIHEKLLAKDRDYFRSTREERLGESLEAAHAKRECLLPGLRAALEPVRLAARKAPYLGGQSPSYMDFMALGVFIWAGSVATTELLEKDDPVHGWLGRGLDLFGGIGRSNHLPGFAFTR